MTDDVRSNKTVVRQTYVIKWFDKPWGLGPVIEWEVKTDFREDNKRWIPFFTQATELFKRGPPYISIVQDLESKEIINSKHDGTYVEPETSPVDRPEIIIPDHEYHFDSDSEEEEEPVVIVKPEDMLPVVDPVNLTPAEDSDEDDEDEEGDDEAGPKGDDIF